MKVVFRSKNGGRKTLSNRHVALIEDFVRFVMQKFLKPRALKQLRIEIILDGKFFEKEKCYGQAIWVDRPRRPRKFLLEMDTRTNFVFILNSISHELVHVKQWAIGEFYIHQDDPAIHTFRRKQYRLEDEDWDYYWEVPWEIEAYGRSIGLMQQWINARGYKNESWYSDKIWETEQRVEAIDKPAKG